jgi:hypothetical protein
MKPIEGIKVNKVGFDIRKEIDLLYFEGPLLTLFSDTAFIDMYYIFKWCEVNESYNKWMVAIVTKKDLLKFFDKSLPLYDLFNNTPFLYILDIDNELNYQNTIITIKDCIPLSYFPEKNSIYSELYYTESSQKFAEKLSSSDNRITQSSSLHQEHRFLSRIGQNL